MSAYQNTIPFFVCQENYKQCIQNHPNDLDGQNQCKANAKCGTLNATAMEDSASTWATLSEQAGPDVAQYAVAMDYRIRFVMQMSAREAMHLIELRSSPQGHPTYRRVAQQMHDLIEKNAGHRAIARTMTYLDTSDVDLERLEAERRAEAKRRAARAG